MMEYIKIAVRRGLHGTVLGLAIGYTAFLIISFMQGEMLVDFKGVLVNYSVAMLVGFWMAAISVVYDVDEWSILKQTIFHALLQSPYIPVAFAIGWAPPDIKGRIIFLVVYVLVFVTIWLSFRFYWMGRVRELNEQLEKFNIEE